MNKIVLSVLLCLFPALLLTGSMNENKEKIHKLTDIRFNTNHLDITVGGKAEITVFSVPSVAVQPQYQWSSEKIATAVVNDGWVERVTSGKKFVGIEAMNINEGIQVNVTHEERIVKSHNDTIVRMTFSGTDCSFADYADYGIYIPTLKESLKGVLILQHGCGMEQFGITRPYDLQYQSFARKWKLAVIETALHGNCSLWRDPSAGTYSALLKVLDETAVKTGHPELNTVPWLLFGHSGGGYWTLAMLKEHPERIMAAVCYSAAWDPQWDYPAATAEVPILLRHAGANDGNSDGVLCWATAVHTFDKLRNMNAIVSIAHNPEQNHNYSYLRYMSIPFYEAVMKQRMPEDNKKIMRKIDRTKTWLGDTLTLQICNEAAYTGDKAGYCVLPDEATAKLWQEYVSTGTIIDKTPPPAPFNVKAEYNKNGITITWEADADIESGILRFEIFKNDILVGRLPESGAYQRFDTNGDNTIPIKVPEIIFRIEDIEKEEIKISVRTINHFNLNSEKTEITIKAEQ